MTTHLGICFNPYWVCFLTGLDQSLWNFSKNPSVFQAFRFVDGFAMLIPQHVDMVVSNRKLNMGVHVLETLDA